jgi:hypothetical protein
VVSHAGLALLRRLSDVTGLTGGPSKALASKRLLVHDRGAQLTLFEIEDGWWYTLWATNLPDKTYGWRGQVPYIDAAHRVHARVEDVIRTGKDCGYGKLPSSALGLNKAWFTASLIAAGLIARLKLIALDGDLARAESRTLRYRIFHAAAPLVKGARRRGLKIAAIWPWPMRSSLPGTASPSCPRPPDQRGPRSCDRERNSPGPVETPAPARQPGQCHARALHSRSTT